MPLTSCWRRPYLQRAMTDAGWRARHGPCRQAGAFDTSGRINGSFPARQFFVGGAMINSRLTERRS
jgi:hypothetical protein